ncbi:MAG: DnaD domain protein [Lachnospiraceae bacterium]|nr:DnaD domain protein [Lachnospiraceae bacterium]
MSNFTLKHDGYIGSTSITNSFIRDYMPKAAGEFVKIYIYLLMCLEEKESSLSISDIADVFNNTEKDVIRALKYWERKGLLELTFDDGELSSLCVTHVSADGSRSYTSTVSTSTGAVQTAPVDAAPQQSAAKYQKRAHSREEIDAFSCRDDFSVTITMAQQYLGRPFTGTEINTLMFFHEELGFPSDLIEYLFDYCTDGGHKDMRYIETVAINWAEQGIKNVAAAKLLNSVYTDKCRKVLSAFGLSGRDPSRSESEWVAKWNLSYGFNTEMILEACNRTMNAIHKPSFDYTDSILQNWKSNKVTTINDLKKLDAQHKSKTKAPARKPASKPAQGNKFNNFPQRDYDWEELENKLINQGLK